MWMLHNMAVVLKVNMKNLVWWDECFCKCYILIWLMFSKWIWKTLSDEMNVNVNVTFWFDLTDVLKVNMKNLVWWDECLCECYITWLLFSKWIWKTLCDEMNVFVNVTFWFDWCSQSEYEKPWVMRWMFVWMLHFDLTDVLKVNMKNLVWWDECLCECYIIWVLFSKWIWKNLCDETNVYVNVTFDWCSQTKWL
jgi:hypothetical protein